MKMSRMIQKSAATILMALLVAQSSLAAIVSAPPQDHSAEITVLESLIGLQGRKLSKSQAQSEARAALEQYYASSSKEGRIERMSAAMIEMGIADQDQIKDLQSALVEKAKSVQAEGREISHADLASAVKEAAFREQSGSAFNPNPIFAGMIVLGLTIVAVDVIGGSYLSGPVHALVQRTEAVLILGGLLAGWVVNA